MNKQQAVGNLNTLLAIVVTNDNEYLAYIKVPSFHGALELQLLKDSIKTLVSDKNEHLLDDILYGSIKLSTTIDIPTAVVEDLGKAGVTVPGIKPSLSASITTS